MDINNAILIGNLTRDPELRITPGGNSVANFTIAVNDGYGENKTVDFIRCTAWRKTAEAVTNYCQKGSRVAVQGKIKQQNWKDKEGNNREKVFVNVQQVMFLNTKTQQAKMEPEFEDPGGGYSMDSDVFIEGDTPF